ncbi:hypothetical protein OQA88_4239 [Cercophora sp. LCS_1]
MPTKSHHRSRSSVDQVLGLLADLPEHQIALLLDDFNHTTASNVPVSKAIAIFDPSVPKPRRIFSQTTSPVKKLEAELVRRHSKRISSAPQPVVRPRTASPPPPVVQQQTQLPQPPTHVVLEPEPSFFGRPGRPSLTLSPPDFFERPQTADAPAREVRSRSYKRISRPLILSPTATAELHQLLLAYLYETPASATSSASSSPITPDAASPFSPFAPIHQDRGVRGLDLLEPSPAREPQYIFGKRGTSPTESMSGIFEVLTSH